MDTIAFQRHRINRAINFAQRHRTEKLSLAMLADAACFSKDHFVRTFDRFCQETPMEFFSRMRLEHSITNLTYHPHLSITEIAFDAGYLSQQAYCDAFRNRYGISPRGFRKRNVSYIEDFPGNQYTLAPALSGIPPVEVVHFDLSDVRVIPTRQRRLAYIRYRGPYFDLGGGRSAAITRLYQWAKRIGIWQDDTTIIGIGSNNPIITPPQFCQYDIGIEVEDGVDEDDLVSVRLMPALTVAAMDVAGSTQHVREACRWLSSEWFAQSGYKMANYPCFEYYKPFQGKPGNNRTGIQLCMPVSTDPSGKTPEISQRAKS